MLRATLLHHVVTFSLCCSFVVLEIRIRMAKLSHLFSALTYRHLQALLSMYLRAHGRFLTLASRGCILVSNM